MAPEVARGGAATRASDVYGLGAVLYVLLTGRPPFLGASVSEVLRQVASASPAPPRSLNPAAPPALDAICRKAMARDPADRYASADEVATEVRRWLADEPVHAHPEPWAARLARWARRRRTTVVAVAIFLLTAAVVAAVAAALLWREEQKTAAQKDLAERHAARALDAQELAERNARLARGVSADALGLVQAVEWVLASTGPLHDLRRDLLAAGSRAFREHLDGAPDDPDLRSQAAHIFLYAANVSRLEGDDRAADGLYRDAVSLLDGLLAQAPAEAAYRAILADCLKDWAVLLARVGPQRRADALYERSLAALEPLRDPAGDPPGIRRMRARALLNRSVTLRLLGDEAAALAAAREAADLLAALVDAPPDDRHPYDPLLLARALTLAAVGHRDAGRIEEARELHAEAARAFAPLNEAAPFGVTEADVAWTAAVCRLERGRTWALDGDPRAWGALDAAVTGYELLADGFPWVIGYAFGLADALLARAEARADAGEPGAPDDLERARAVAAPLVASHPDAQRYRSLLGRIESALARALPDADADPDRRAELLRGAEAHLAAAVAADPDVPSDRAALDDARAALRRVEQPAAPPDSP